MNDASVLCDLLLRAFLLLGGALMVAAGRPESRTRVASPQGPGGEYSLLFAANPIPMWVFDPETLRFFEVNEAAVAKYGFSRDEFLGMTIADIRPPEDVAGLRADMKALMAAGLNGPALVRHRRKDGTLLTVQITAQDIVFTKRPARLVVAQDLSERERLAAEVHKEHQFLQSILDGMPAAVFVKDRQSRFTLVNAAWERITGVPRDQATGMTAHDLFPVDVADRMRGADEATFDADDRTEIEQSLSGDRGPRTYLTSRFPLRDEGGRIEGLVGLAIDITERTRAAAALDRANAFTESVIQTANVIFLHLDAAGIVRKINAAAEEITGYTRAEVEGTSWFERLVPRHRYPYVWAGFERLLKEGVTASSFENPILTKEGEERQILWRNSTLREGDQIVGIISFGVDVTERRQAEDRAQAEREHSRRDADRLAAIVQSSSDAIYAKSLDGTIVAWNASAERLFGYTPVEARGRSAKILLPPGAENELTEIRERISAGERIDHKETTRVHKDGSLVFVSLSESPLRDAEGKVVGVSVIAHDVSEQRHAERALLESEKKLRAFVESDVVGILVGDSSGGLEANDEFLRMTGYSREDLRAGRLRWAEITPPEFRPKDEAAHTEAMARGACTPYEKQFVRKDGTRVWVLVGYALLDREHDRSVGFVLDIDARKRAEDELRRSEERFARVFQSNLIAIGIAEMTSGRLIDVNNRCAEFFGYARDEMIGHTVFELGLWANPVDRERLVAGTAAGGSSMEAGFRRKSGEIRHALVSMEAITLAGIAEPLDIVVLVDMTERQRLESQLMQAQKMEAVGRLAGGVAHDFNNSLGVIMGYTELLLRQASDPQRGKLDQILRATQHASGLTRQLLAFSRKQIVDPRVLDLNALLWDLEKMLGRLIGEDIDLAIVPGADLGQLKIDPGQFEQVVMNLCVNARDAMPDGGLLRIETANAELDAGHAAGGELMAAGRYVMLAVSDTGSGIDEEILSKIFEPFFTTKELGKGTGLGLAMVYGIVKQAGGYVWVSSEVGRGTTFKIYLPRIDEPVAATAVAQDTPMPSKGWETILLVEDEASLRAITREILEEHGYRVIEATGPADAIEMARRHPGPIHLLITDVVMPGMNGRVLAESLVAALPELRVLYMSGYTDDVIAHSGVLDSGTLLLEKPFTVLALLARVRVALGERNAGENE